MCAVVVAPAARASRTAADLPEIDSDKPVGWRGDSVTFELTSAARGVLSTSSQVAALAAALSTWNQALCGSLSLNFGGTAADSARPDDGRNTIVLVDSGWADRGFDATTAAYTDVSYRQDPQGWAVVEADIYVNAEDFTWVSGGDTGKSQTLRSLDAVLSHEIGHALGLLHPCETEPTDDIPACSADRSFAETMMFPDYNPLRLSLNEDDRDGLCWIYGCASGCSPETNQGEGGAGGYVVTGSATEGGDHGGGDPCDAPGCAEEPSDLGEACETADDCTAGVCLAGAESHPICSMSCDEHSCSEGWSCSTVDGSQVCVPPIDFKAAGGCALAASQRSLTTTPAACLAGSLVVLFLRRRRRRSRIVTERRT